MFQELIFLVSAQQLTKKGDTNHHILDAEKKKRGRKGVKLQGKTKPPTKVKKDVMPECQR